MLIFLLYTVLFYRNARFEKFSLVNLIPFIISMTLHCMKSRLKTEGRPRYVEDFRFFDSKTLFKWHL